MKKTAIAVLVFFVCGVAARAQQQPAAPAMPAKAEVKQEIKAQTKKVEKKVEKLRTLTGVIESIDAEKGTITAKSVKFKNEVMTFPYADVKFMDGKKEVKGEMLKVGDKIKLKYEGDIKTPVIKKAMIMKEEFKKKMAKKEAPKAEEKK